MDNVSAGGEAGTNAQQSVAGFAMRAAFDHATCKEVHFEGGPSRVLTDDAEDNQIRGRGLLTLGLSKSLTDVRVRYAALRSPRRFSDGRSVPPITADRPDARADLTT